MEDGTSHKGGWGMIVSKTMVSVFMMIFRIIMAEGVNIGGLRGREGLTRILVD